MDKRTKRRKRAVRTRHKIVGKAPMPRLSVNRSNMYIYAQIVDDEKGVTLVSANDKKLKGTNMEKAALVGEAIAKEAKKKKIEKVVFDRGGFVYHGRVKALAEGARKGGLKF